MTKKVKKVTIGEAESARILHLILRHNLKGIQTASDAERLQEAFGTEVSLFNQIDAKIAVKRSSSMRTTMIILSRLRLGGFADHAIEISTAALIDFDEKNTGRRISGFDVYLS